MIHRYLYSYVLLLLSVIVFTEAKAQKVVKWEEDMHKKNVLSAPVNKEFKLTFEVDNYQNFELVLRGHDDGANNINLFTITFKHSEVSFDSSHKIPYHTGDVIGLAYNSDLLQVMINGHKVFTTLASQGTPERIIYKSTEPRGIPPQINMVK